MKKSYKIIIGLILIILISFCVSIFPKNSTKVLAVESAETDIINEVDKTLEDIDFSGFDEIIKNMTNQDKSIFSNGSFLEKVKDLISGKTSINFSSIASAFFSILSNEILAIIPLLCTIIALGVLSSITNQANFSKDKTVAEIVHFVCYAVIIMVVFNAVTGLVKVTYSTLNSLKGQMEIGFPILLTLLTSVGSVVSVSVYQPLVAILSGSLMTIFVNFIMPLFVFCLVFTVVGNLSSNVKLNKFSGLFQSVFKWTIGLVFTLFSAFLTIQGITAGSYDGLSIRTTKYAMKSYIPFVGGYLADGLNLILTSSVLVKNAVGMAGLFLLFSTIISPILKILLLKLVLSLSAGILEPICDKRVVDFLSGISKCLSMLIATICVAGFAYLITIGLIMCTSNVF